MMPKRLQKLCKRCEQMLPREMFYPRKDGSTENQCKPCKKQSVMDWRATAAGQQKYLAANSSEAGRARMRRYFASPKGLAAVKRKHAKRRARSKAMVATLTAAEWQDVMEAHQMRCAYCKQQPAELTLDHVVPISKGGHHVKTNVVPACRPCNSRKKDRLLPPETCVMSGV